MSRICPFCEKNVGNDPHIYGCKYKTTSDKKEIKFLFLSKNFPLLKKEKLEEDYLNNLMSLPDIKNKYNIDYKSILYLLEYFNIPKRNITESANLISKEKYKNTCILKYGVDNVSKTELVKEKKKKTFIENYGVDNIFKDEHFKKWILENNFAWNNLSKEENAERVKKQTKSIKKYWENLTDEYKAKLYRYEGTSSVETTITDVLNELMIPYQTQFPLKGRLFDIKISNTKILVEVNDDYWHCNPYKYGLNDTVNLPYKPNTKVTDVWEKDAKKRIIAINEGYKVIYLWEMDINKSKDLKKLVWDKIFG